MKKNKKIFVTGILVLALSLVFSGCGSSQTGEKSEKVILKLGHVQAETHAFHKGSVKFAETLKEISGGTMEVEVFSNGVLGNERDLLEAVQIGSIDVVSVTSALTSTFNSDYQVFSLPFLFDDYQDAFEVMDDKDITEKLNKKLIDKEIRPIGYWIGGSRSYYGTSAINSIEDFKGLQVRTMEDSYYLKTWESLGAKPTALPFGEVYTGLQTNLVQGAEGAINTYVKSKFNEVAPNVAFINYIYSVQLLNFSEKTWQKLSEEQRNWIMEAGKASADYERQVVLDEDAAMVDTLTELNVKMTFPEIEPMREAVESVYDMFKNQYGDEAYKLVEQIQNK